MRRAGWIGLAVAVVGVVVGGVVWYWDLFGIEERAYVRKNEEIIDSLPAFPGARLVETGSSAYYGDSKWSRAEGHSTSATYAIPTGVAWVDVLAFYAEELADAWEVSVLEPVRAGAPSPSSAAPARFLSADRGKAVVSVQLRTDGPAGTAPAEDPPTQYVVVVDHESR